MCVKLNMIHFQLISANELELKVLFFVIQSNLSRVSTEKMGKLYYFYIVHNYTLSDENVLPGLKKNKQSKLAKNSGVKIIILFCRQADKYRASKDMINNKNGSSLLRAGSTIKKQNHSFCRLRIFIPLRRCYKTFKFKNKRWGRKAQYVAEYYQKMISRMNVT